MTDLLGFQINITCEEGGRNLKFSISVKKKSLNLQKHVAASL